MRLKLNDIITKDNDTKKVLEVLTQTALLSYVNKLDVANGWFTEEELLADGWVFPVEKWVPEENGKYWFINTNGETYSTLNNVGSDAQRISIGNCYETEAEAKEALTRVLAAYKG